MTRAIIYFVLGAVLLGLGIWWWTIVGPSFAFLAPIILQGVGGAFMGIALVLVLYAVLALLRGDAAFPVTPQVLSIIVAVAIVGAFATYNTKQEGSRTQVGALIVAVVLIGLGFIAPDTELMATTPFWLIGWALAAGLCAVVLRRSAAGHA